VSLDDRLAIRSTSLIEDQGTAEIARPAIHDFHPNSAIQFSLGILDCAFKGVSGLPIGIIRTDNRICAELVRARKVDVIELVLK